MLLFRVSALALIAVLATGPAIAQGATLPGGASSLTEAHGDWLVKCSVTPDAPAPICALSQEQASTETQQRVLAIEVQPRDGGIVGTLVLPFGLDLSAGVTLTIDDAVPMPAQPFRTCVPGGCLVSLDFAADLVTELRTAEALKIGTVADGGTPTPFSISLNGFAGALDRTIALVAPPQ